MINTQLINAQWCGLLSYAEGLRAQEEAVSSVSGASPGLILGLEHSSVITLGKRGIPEEDLNASETELRARKVELFRSERGGQATLHSPGQLV
ncbi:MAG: lipoyl synthase, partial [Bdellovibrionota bacterium]